MSVFSVNIVAINPAEQDKCTLPIEAIVDAGSELTWLPKDVLKAIGITATRKRNFLTATKQLIHREVGYASLRAEGFETIDEVVL